MLTRQNTTGRRLSAPPRKGVRFIAVGYLTALMTLCTPFPTLNSPRLEPSLARADELPIKSQGWLIAHYEYGYNERQFSCLKRLWGKESAWNHLADNPTSTAFGIAQMLNETSKDPATQIRNGLKYISFRYTTACNAWRFWQKENWY